MPALRVQIPQVNSYRHSYLKKFAAKPAVPFGASRDPLLLNINFARVLKTKHSNFWNGVRIIL